MAAVFPAIEPLRADEAGDGTDLPIYNINIGGAQSFGVTVKRHGLRRDSRLYMPMRLDIGCARAQL